MPLEDYLVFIWGGVVCLLRRSLFPDWDPGPCKWVKGTEQRLNTSIILSFLIVDFMWPAASSPRYPDFTFLMDCVFELWVRINPFPFMLSLSGYFIQWQERKQSVLLSILLMWQRLESHLRRGSLSWESGSIRLACNWLLMWEGLVLPPLAWWSWAIETSRLNRSWRSSQ